MCELLRGVGVGSGVGRDTKTGQPRRHSAQTIIFSIAD